MTLEAERAAQGASTPAPAPEHVAIIMDGNGRWAKQQGMPRLAGHRAGTANIRPILSALHAGGVRYVTLFAFSTENWGRPGAEVKGLLGILQTVIKDEIDALHRQNVRIRHLGVLDRLPYGLAQAITGAVELTRNNDGLSLCVAFDYGGRAEIVSAVREILAKGAEPTAVTEEAIRAHLFLPDVPDPDLIVRTAGEQRLSNFMIWQAAYSEFYQSSVYWPDFGEAEVRVALEEYGRRKRRFGLLPSED